MEWHFEDWHSAELPFIHSMTFWKQGNVTKLSSLFCCHISDEKIYL
jgi:hypothetical protein